MKASEVANTLFFRLQASFDKRFWQWGRIKQTFTSLSHPADTMTGLEGFGLKRTHDTHSVWPFSVMVNLQSPRVFQSLMERSLDPETIWRLSAEKDTDRTSLVCPTKRRVVWPVDSSQRRRVLSQEADKA